MTREKVCQACSCGGAGSCSSGCQFNHLCGKDGSKGIKEALKLIEDKFNDVPGNMPIVATGTPMIEVYRIVSDLLKKRDEAIIEEVEKLIIVPHSHRLHCENYSECTQFTNFETTHNRAVTQVVELLKKKTSTLTTK